LSHSKAMTFAFVILSGGDRDNVAYALQRLKQCIRYAPRTRCLKSWRLTPYRGHPLAMGSNFVFAGVRTGS